MTDSPRNDKAPHEELDVFMGHSFILGPAVMFLKG
jgi:hypothetical protein